MSDTTRTVLPGDIIEFYAPRTMFTNSGGRSVCLGGKEVSRIETHDIALIIAIQPYYSDLTRKCLVVAGGTVAWVWVEQQDKIVVNLWC